MRLDKYLKVSRLIKRRTVAKDACDKERVEVNGKDAKPATNIKEGDLIAIIYGNNKIVVRVLQIRQMASKADASHMYEIVEQTKISE